MTAGTPPGLDGSRPTSQRHSIGAGASLFRKNRLEASFSFRQQGSLSHARSGCASVLRLPPAGSGLRPPAATPLPVRGGAGPADLHRERHAARELPALRRGESGAREVGGRQAAVDQGTGLVPRQLGAAAAGGRARPHAECCAGPGTAGEIAGIGRRFSRVAVLGPDCLGGSVNTRVGGTRNSQAEGDAGATARGCAQRLHVSRHERGRTVCAGRLRLSDAAPTASVSSGTSADWKATLSGWPRRHRSRIARTVTHGGNCGTRTVRRESLARRAFRIGRGPRHRRRKSNELAPGAVQGWRPGLAA